MSVKMNSERSTLTIIYTDCSIGLGIKIIGGSIKSRLKCQGIFVKNVLVGGLAKEDGRLQVGDQILQVNGQSLEDMSNDEAVSLLRQASATDYIHLLVTRDDMAKIEFLEITSNCSDSEIDSTSPIFPDSGNWTAVTKSEALTFENKINAMSGSVTESGESVNSLDERSSTSHTDEIINQYQHEPLLHELPPIITSLAFQPSLTAPAMSSTPQTAFSGRTLPQTQPSYLSRSVDHPIYEPSPVVAQPFPNLDNPDSFQTLNQASLSSTPVDPKKFSLDPNVRIKVEKLQLALQYLGLKSTASQMAELRSKLSIDKNDTVTYGEFVKASQQIFRDEIEKQVYWQEDSANSSLNITDFTEPPTFKKSVNSRPLNFNYESVNERLIQERDEFIEENARLRKLLQEKECSLHQTEMELLSLRREAQVTIEEKRALHARLVLADQAQEAARNVERDYEDVLRLLEADLIEKKENEKPKESVSVRKRLAIMACQLRKSDLSKKTYEVAAGKLLEFAEIVRETFDKAVDKSVRLEQSELLAEQARDVIRTVKSLIEIDPLPFGWEEAYTTDGTRYYINHVTQMTSWQHPISKVQEAPGAPLPATAPSKKTHINKNKLIK